uniref:PNPLA domain-containing protein n=1 Tax=Nothobranchius furzeri TaxID=105023 RepID=A0A8C6NTN2_NOTFU
MAEWNISFAGCGFRSIYYVGALSCILERVPQLVHGASKIGGASSGCLVAAALAVGIPIGELLNHPIFFLICEQVLYFTFSLILREMLPEDAHLRATGKLCVSLTRLSDGENVLVSEFTTREELIQVLMCSSFFPVYCGFVPPSYRGVLYMDGALSNNMPLFELRNTITMAPFSGESDICPKEGTFNFFEANYEQKLAEICHNGYMDALRFLKERGAHTHLHVPQH